MSRVLQPRNAELHATVAYPQAFCAEPRTEGHHGEPEEMDEKPLTPQRPEIDLRVDLSKKPLVVCDFFLCMEDHKARPGLVLSCFRTTLGSVG